MSGRPIKRTLREDCVNEFVEATDRVKAALNAAGIESGGDGPRPAR